MQSINKNLCPSCIDGILKPFYRVESVPTNSVLQVSSKEHALCFPSGIIHLGHCLKCNFISNMDFSPEHTEYTGDYESTQSFSPTFSRFNRNLAEDLILRYNLRDKRIIEIGCGNGEFLNLLCELGNNSGLGFDPAFQAGRIDIKSSTDIRFIQDFFSELYSEHTADIIICKMTLEHISTVANFVRLIRSSITKPDTLVFFQVPDTLRILKEIAFWDIYYEHCSYFTLSTLSDLFRRNRFDIIDLWKDFDGQYIMLTAQPGSGNAGCEDIEEKDRLDLLAYLSLFNENYSDHLEYYRCLIEEWHSETQKTVIWGGGSKGVSFLTTLNIRDEIEYAVDINPNKNGMFLPISGQKIVDPGFLKQYIPDHVIVMNSIYRDEITMTLNNIGLSPKLHFLEGEISK